MKKKISYKKTRVFLHKRISDFERQYRGLLTLKKSWKSLEPFSRYGAFLDLGMPGQTGFGCQRDKNKNFCSLTPNDPIRKVNRLKWKFEHLSKIFPTTGWSQPSLRKFSPKSENKVFDHLVEWGWFTQSDIAYSDRDNRYLTTGIDECV